MIRNVAIIGAGIGAEHCTGYASLPGRFAIHTICDLDEARGRALADKHGARFRTAFDAVLADPGVDIVDICLPPHLHLSASISALEAGKAVVCEKPLVGSLREADHLAQAVARTGADVFPVFQYRWGTGTAQLRALKAAGLVGPCHVATLETHWNRPASYYQVPWRGTWAGERGGAILGHAIHIHDLLPHLLGPVISVYAELGTRVNRIEVEDCAAIVFRMADGALVTSSVTLGAAEDRSRLCLVFEGLTVHSDQSPYAPAARPWHFIARNPADQPQINKVLEDLSPQPVGYAGLFGSIADALDGQPGTEVTLDAGRRSIELVTAIYASSRNAQPVTLPLPADHPLYDGWQPED